jgi:hypothetical protein
MTADSWDLLIRRHDFRQRRIAPGADAGAPLAPRQVRVRVDRFALTANNVTYAVVGEQVGYWRFFPAPEGWGRAPVWGFAQVTESAHPEVAAGERLYGYWPMSTHAVITVGRLTPGALTEDSEHRRALPGAYNHYIRTAADPAHRAGGEDATALLRPLFTTSFLLDDQLADAAFHGAEAVLLTSASSKTALGLAWLLHARRDRPRVVGLTSAGNRPFVEGLALYDQVLTYDDLSALDALASAVAVDFAGRDALTAEVHRRLGDRLKLSLKVGVTHWEADRGGAAPEHGPAPAWFFAPDRMKARSAEWGRDGFAARLGEAWNAFIPSTAAWLRTTYVDGPEALDAAFGRFLEGAADPAEGVIARPAGAA